MEKPELVQVGDVISSPEFSIGQYEAEFVDHRLELDRSVVLVGRGFGTTYLWTLHEEKDGWKRDTKQSLDGRANDESRGAAKFVVERASWYGNINAGWQVRARRLHEDGSYNPDGELIEFFQSTGYDHSILHPKIEMRGGFRTIMTAGPMLAVRQKDQEDKGPVTDRAGSVFYDMLPGVLNRAG